MWNKTDEAPRQPPAPSARPAAARASVIGPSIRIKGDVSGQEDLVIQGKLEGEVQFKANNVTVGREGRIRADIYGRSVHVEGEVQGHLYGVEEVVIRSSGKVQGDIISPRVVLENGSNFKGSIDMEPASKPAPPVREAKPAAAAPVAPKHEGSAPETPAPQSKRGGSNKASAAGNRP